jgi:hypothetical protein
MNEVFEDQQLVCRDCGERFVWTMDQQQYFAKRLLQQPKRRQPCRNAVSLAESHGDNNSSGSSTVPTVFKLNAYLASTAVSGNSWFVTVQVF